MRKFLPLLLLAAASAPAWARHKPPEKIVVLTNVTIVETDTGNLRPHLTVVIKKGRITAIARRALIEESPQIVIVNGEGKYLIPGLWDMHVHLLLWADEAHLRSRVFPLLLANGVTGVRDMGGDLETLKRLRAAVASGAVPGPRLVFSGPMLDGPEPADQPAIAIGNPQEARAAVDALKRQGADFIKVKSRLSGEAYFAIAEECRKEKIPFAGHVPGAVTAREASDAGQRSEEHLLGILEACSSQEDAIRGADAEEQLHPPKSPEEANAYGTAERQRLLATYDPQKAAALFARFVANHTWQVPTLALLDQVRQWASTAEVVPDPAWKYLPPAQVQRAREAAQGFRAGRDTANLASWRDLMQRNFELVGAMQRAGVGILAGTDSPPGEAPGFVLHRELQLLVEAGLTPAQALRAATLNPARFLGKEKEMGEAEVGREADLVLLDADPTTDIRNLDKIAGVVAAGRYYSRRELDQMLAQAEAAAKEEK